MQEFKIKFELFGKKQIATLRANSLGEAKDELNKSILSKVHILSTETVEPPIKQTVEDLFKNFQKKMGEFFDGLKS